MRKLLGLLMILVTGMVLMSSCTDAARSKIGGYGDEFTVQMYSGGILVREWTSSGKVKSEEGSDGYYFMDKLTNQLVEVAGDIVITSKLNRTSDSQYSIIKDLNQFPNSYNGGIIQIDSGNGLYQTNLTACLNNN